MVNEERIGRRDYNSPDWYAQYVTAELRGTQLPE